MGRPHGRPNSVKQAARGKLAAAAVLPAAAVLVVVSGCSAAEKAGSPPSTNHPAAPATPTTGAAVPSTTVAPTTAPSPPTTAPAPVPAHASTALAGLSRLPVKGRAPLTGYSRAQFGPAWTDDVTVPDGHNGCDTRNDILRRDLTMVVLKPGTHGCVVLSGVLRDPYTGTVIPFTRGESTSAAVQIDHVVALANAWQTGAQQLSLAVRTNLANDPLELLAVSGPANEQKGDADAATWLPSNKAFRCPYVARQVAVKIQYHLWVTPAERAAIDRVLATCPTEPLPTEGSPPHPALAPRPPATTPAPAPPTTARAPPTTAAPAPTTPGVPVVHPGAFCSPPGARGVTAAGTPMTCKLDSTGQHYRWSRAA